MALRVDLRFVRGRNGVACLGYGFLLRLLLWALILIRVGSGGLWAHMMGNYTGYNGILWGSDGGAPLCLAFYDFSSVQMTES